MDDWLADASTSASLKQRLVQARAMRRFAVTDLALPDNASYQRYAELPRPYVVWNVVAASEWSLELKRWCFPVAGCVAYRGYFNEEQAQREADLLREQGLEVSVYGVPAYSTLGWLNWLGGDPLLSTFIHYPEGELARLMFHELAHQVLYVADDTVFNESFASAVERLGGERWLSQQASAQARQAFVDFDHRRQQFRQLARRTRARLQQLYQSHEDQSGALSVRRAQKAQVMQDFRAAYAELKAGWGGYAGYDAWVARANNAAFGAQAAYDELVPGFEALFASSGQDWPRFFEAVRQLAKRTPTERRQRLQRAAAG